MSEVSDRFWYRSYYGSEIAVMPWAEDTAADLEFIGRFAPLSSPLQILDLACGMGRHAVALAARGHLVTAVDISPDLIDGALASAEREGVDVNFVCGDIREVDAGQYDLVLNLWEGAIGYLESEAENLRIFEVIGASLRPGGIHVAGPLINRDFV